MRANAQMRVVGQALSKSRLVSRYGFNVSDGVGAVLSDPDTTTLIFVPTTFMVCGMIR
jgi:hypothetical protein